MVNKINSNLYSFLSPSDPLSVCFDHKQNKIYIKGSKNRNNVIIVLNGTNYKEIDKIGAQKELWAGLERSFRIRFFIGFINRNTILQK